MISSVHINDKGNDILILGNGPKKGLNHTQAAETQYSDNLQDQFCLSLH